MNHRYFYLSQRYTLHPVVTPAPLITPAVLAKRVIKLALPDAVEEALPLVAVVHENPFRWVADDPHQHPLGGRPVPPAGEGDLDGALPVPLALPG